MVSFLDLSPEVRNLIYTQIFESEQFPPILPIIRDAASNQANDGEVRLNGLNLALTNREVHNETSLLFHERVRLGLLLTDSNGKAHTHAHMQSEVNRFCTSSPAPKIQHLELGYRDLLPVAVQAGLRENPSRAECQGRLSRWMRTVSTKNSVSNREMLMKLVKQLSTVLPNVQTLTIHSDFRQLFCQFDKEQLTEIAGWFPKLREIVSLRQRPYLSASALSFDVEAGKWDYTGESRDVVAKRVLERKTFYVPEE